MTEPAPNQPLRAFLGTLQPGETCTGVVVGVEEREVLVELDGFAGPGPFLRSLTRGEIRTGVVAAVLLSRRQADQEAGDGRSPAS